MGSSIICSSRKEYLLKIKKGLMTQSFLEIKDLYAYEVD